MSDEQKVEVAPQATPTSESAPKYKKERKGKFFRDLVAEKALTDPQTSLYLITGEPFTGELQKATPFAFRLADNQKLEKRDCLGVLPKSVDTLLLSKDKPKQPVAYHRRERVNFDKIEALDPSLKGGRLRLSLASGWELEGDVEAIAKFYVVLQLDTSTTIQLYRHAITDYEVVREGDGTVPKRERIEPAPPKPKKPKPEPTPQEPKIDFSKLEWWALLAAETRRQNVNAKIKLVLREIPAEAREMGDIIWIPLQNTPKDLPAGIALAPSPLDLVVTKKSWKGAAKKAMEIKTQTGVAPIFVFEALIGIQQGRLAAVATGIQVVEGKPPTPRS